jgi:hypothetical protein
LSKSKLCHKEWESQRITHSEQSSKAHLRLQEPTLMGMALITPGTRALSVYQVRPINVLSIRKQTVIITQVAEPCLGQTNDVELSGANVVITFKGFGPETYNVLMTSVKSVAEIRMRNNRTIRACIIEIGLGQVNIALLPLSPSFPFGFAADLRA